VVLSVYYKKPLLTSICIRTDAMAKRKADEISTVVKDDAFSKNIE
jgi:hypothetical protein